MQSVKFRQIVSVAQRKLRIRWVWAAIFIFSLETVFPGYRKI